MQNALNGISRRVQSATRWGAPKRKVPPLKERYRPFTMFVCWRPGMKCTLYHDCLLAPLNERYPLQDLSGAPE